MKIWVRIQSIPEVGDRDAVLHKKYVTFYFVTIERKTHSPTHIWCQKVFHWNFIIHSRADVSQGLEGKPALASWKSFASQCMHIAYTVHIAYCTHSAYCILYTEWTDAHCNNAQMQAYTSQIGSESLKWCHHCGGGNGARERNSECKGVCSGRSL